MTLAPSPVGRWLIPVRAACHLVFGSCCCGVKVDYVTSVCILTFFLTFITFLLCCPVFL